MARKFNRPRLTARVLGTGLVLQLGLSGCAMGGMGDQLPQSIGGLPAAAPARPTTPYQYPAVHDMPPSRASTPLDESEQIKLEKELQGIRTQQESLAADPDAAPAAAAAPAPKTKPPAPKTKPATGAKTNP